MARIADRASTMTSGPAALFRSSSIATRSWTRPSRRSAMKLTAHDWPARAFSKTFRKSSSSRVRFVPGSVSPAMSRSMGAMASSFGGRPRRFMRGSFAPVNGLPRRCCPAVLVPASFVVFMMMLPVGTARNIRRAGCNRRSRCQGQPCGVRHNDSCRRFESVGLRHNRRPQDGEFRFRLGVLFLPVRSNRFDQCGCRPAPAVPISSGLPDFFRVFRSTRPAWRCRDTYPRRLLLTVRNMRRKRNNRGESRRTTLLSHISLFSRFIMQPAFPLFCRLFPLDRAARRRVRSTMRWLFRCRRISHGD